MNENGQTVRKIPIVVDFKQAVGLNPDMARPHVDIPDTLHGAVKELAKSYDMTTEEAYTLAAKLLVRADSGVAFDPDDEETEKWLRKAAVNAENLD